MTFDEKKTEQALQYNRAQHYDGRIGRFINNDPLGCEPSDANLYPYPSAPTGGMVTVYARCLWPNELRHKMRPAWARFIGFRNALSSVGGGHPIRIRIGLETR
jgi:hypothetical protein